MIIKKIELKNKKGWIKIFEAFIAIILIISTMLVVYTSQKKQVDRPEEITRLLSSTLDIIGRDDSLRGEILSNNTFGVNNTIEKIIPFWIGYSSRICSYDEICSNPQGYLDKSVYTDEILVMGNLTNTLDNPVKLKIFFWEK